MGVKDWNMRTEQGERSISIFLVDFSHPQASLTGFPVDVAKPAI